MLIANNEMHDHLSRVEVCNYNFYDWWDQMDPQKNGWIDMENFGLFFKKWDESEEAERLKNMQDK